eukprot:TRINITY_DN9473_c0_g1_i1.p1 TRINITY_DN9473_c0_g1~~TRINITY_DN9473_c0_g1_i1.p1  ORF type:complete len:739 (+),score=141.90 TRINITY_DN9473_c0_g1_i1:67-2217(+)
MLSAALLAWAASAAPTNFLFVLTDDMGWGDVSFNKEYLQPGAGGENWTVNPPRTPHIDALALGENTMRFRRFYAGSAVCSPTRASILSGRTPQRSCIDSAEGCGQSPAWSCYDRMPFPPTEFSVAEAAKQKGYATMFVGKWHLGDFWDKGESPEGHYALGKWPASNPGMHGFDEWAATEASAASCTTNCGCVSAWKSEGQGCVTGGGVWKNAAYDCTNYWGPTDLNASHLPTRPECLGAKSCTRDCVANLTQKIVGDDSMHIMDVFEDFLHRKSAKGAEPSPWLAQLSIHTNHVPHPALPEWYHAYTEAEGGPAGDYLGTISQMDAAIGRLSDMLRSYGHWDNTMMWFCADNGAHTDGRPSGQNSASNGLRQCKASLFEGGIRVAGFVVWPQAIKTHQDTLYPACTVDYLPTVMELLGVQHPHPEWAHDGTSLVPLLKGELPVTAHRPKPLGFAQSGQVAWMNDTGPGGVWKIVLKPQRGQCKKFLPPYGDMKNPNGPFLFNLTADPTESDDRCSAEPQRCDAMKKALADFQASIANSRVNESECAAAAPPGPSPPSPSGKVFELTTADGQCLTIQGLSKHAIAVIGACDSGAKWQYDGKERLVNAAVSSMCLKLDEMNETGPCLAGSTVWIGKCGGTTRPKDAFFTLDARGRLASRGCEGMCLVPATRHEVFVYTSAAVALGSCDAPDVLIFTQQPEPVGGWQGLGYPTWEGFRA